MDEVDIQLCKLLGRNSRTPYRDLAARLDLSVNAVHKRIQALVDLGIIREFRTVIDPAYYSPIAALIIGRSEAADLEAAVRAIGESDRVHTVIVAGANIIYVHAILRELGDIDPLVSMVKDRGQLKEAMTGLSQIASSDKEPIPLGRIDYRIVRSLRRDSRKPLTQVAEEVGTSVKTVRRRLRRMEEADAVRMGIDFEPTSSSDVVTFLHARLRDVGRRGEVIQRLMNEYRTNLLGVSYLSDHPDLLFISLWTRTMRQLKELKDRLASEELFSEMVPNIFFESYSFPSWLDDELERRASGP